jgi:hypothetical protein
VSTSISAAIDTGKSAVGDFATELKKADLDAKIDSLSGGLTSPLNGAVPDIDAIKEGTSAFGKVVQNPLGSSSISSAADTIGSLQSVTGSISSNAADISSAVSKLSGGNLATGIQNLAGGISKAAGVLNNVLSLRRGANIPKGGELFSSTGEPISVNATSGDDWRVKINAQWDLFNSIMFNSTLKLTDGFVFPILPEISLSTKANYTQIDPTHNNYPFQAYKNSQVDEISISGIFPVENETDAAYWLAGTTFFKTATKMFFGKGTNAGNPPIICQLSGYGPHIFENVPVVVKSFTVDFPTDVNYIKCGKFSNAEPTWVPVTSTIQISVMPIYNRRNVRGFSLEDYAKGRLTTPTGQGYI